MVQHFIWSGLFPVPMTLKNKRTDRGSDQAMIPCNIYYYYQFDGNFERAFN